MALARDLFSVLRVPSAGIWGAIGPMTDPKSLTWALDQARRELIDLTRRNRLLHAPLAGKRPWCMAITGHTPDQLFEKLYRQENFRGYAFEVKQTAAIRYRTNASNN